MAEVASTDAPGDNQINKQRKTIRIGKAVDDWDLKRMPVVLRSKYAFYREPAARIALAQSNSQNRLQLYKRKIMMEKETEIKKIQESNSIFSNSVVSLNGEDNKKLTLEQTEEMLRFERDRHERLIGQLKAAEARNRKQDEIDNLIESQPTALKSVRLEAFLPPVKPEKLEMTSTLTPIQRRRLERIIDDSNNSFIQRKLY